MNDIELNKLKYPIGKFSYPDAFSNKERTDAILIIQELPAKINEAIKGLTTEQFDTPYRPGGWTVRQLVHHIADSHMNSFVRFKLAMTEDTPTIKSYMEAAWCNMNESKKLDVQPSVKILEGVHERWTQMLKDMSEDDFERTLFHPEMKKELSLNSMLALYRWHSKHHLAHITGLKEMKGWG